MLVFVSLNFKMSRRDFFFILRWTSFTRQRIFRSSTVYLSIEEYTIKNEETKKIMVRRGKLDIEAINLHYRVQWYFECYWISIGWSIYCYWILYFKGESHHKYSDILFETNYIVCVYNFFHFNLHISDILLSLCYLYVKSHYLSFQCNTYLQK